VRVTLVIGEINCNQFWH